MRRPFLALPVLVALVVGVLAAPAITATAADDVAGTISGTVTYPDGDATTTRVEARRPGETHAVATATPDAQGRWSIAVPAGTYHVHVTGDRFAVRQFWGGLTPTVVGVSSGRSVTGIDVLLARGGTVTVRHNLSPGAVQMRLFHDDSGSWVPTTHVASLKIRSGSWRFVGVPPGSYRVLVEDLPSWPDYSSRPAGIAPLPAFLSDVSDVTVTSGSEATLDTPRSVYTGLVEPLRPPAVTEPQRDSRFVLTPGSWPAGTSVVEQRWYVGDAVLEPVSGATGNTFTAAADQRGGEVTVRTVVRRAGSSDTVHWAASRPVHDVVDEGVRVELDPVTADASAFARASGDWLPGQREYHWSLDGRPVATGTSAYYRLPRTSVGQTLQVRVTSDFGHLRAFAVTSVVVGSSSRRLVSRPRVLEARVGESPRLSDVGKIWSPAPDPRGDRDYRFRTQWYLDGRPVALPRPLSPGYAGRRLKARVVLTQPGYRPVTVDTASVRVALAPMRARSAPRIRTTDVTVGDTARASKGRWSPRPTRFRYQWFLRGEPVNGATSTRLKITSAMRGRVIRLRVTASRPGHQPTSRWSQMVRVNY